MKTSKIYIVGVSKESDYYCLYYPTLTEAKAYYKTHKHTDNIISIEIDVAETMVNKEYLCRALNDEGIFSNRKNIMGWARNETKSQ